jgi:ATP-dependent helicase HrpA
VLRASAPLRGWFCATHRRLRSREPAEATVIFIRAALVENRWFRTRNLAANVSRISLAERITSPGTAAASQHLPLRSASLGRPFNGPGLARQDPRPTAFLEHNRRLREKIEMWQTRLTHRVIPDLDVALYGFYATRLTDVSSVHDLNRILKAEGGLTYLCASDRDLLGEQAAAFVADAFPDQIPLGEHQLPVTYAYAPGRSMTA